MYSSDRMAAAWMPFQPTLDQRSSVGWKGIHAAAILYDEYMVRVECGSSYSGEDKAN